MREDPFASDVWVSIGSMDKVNEEEDEQLATEKAEPILSSGMREIEKMEEEVNKMGEGVEEPELEEMKA